MSRRNKKMVVDAALIVVGVLIMSLAYVCFMVPNKIAPGGLTGLSTVFHYLFGLPVGTMTLVMNIPLFLMGFRRMGLFFALRSLFATVTSSLLIDFLPLPALTSNPSAADFELQRMEGGKYLYEQVLETSIQWGTPENTMFVVGATQADMLAGIRKTVPDHFLLVPGVGAQGGSLEEVARHGMNDRCGLLVNSSRGIIYADTSENFADTAAEKAREMQREMDGLLTKYLG